MSASIRLDATTIATIKREAARHGMTNNDYVVLAMFRFKDYDPHSSEQANLIARAKAFAAAPRETKS